MAEKEEIAASQQVLEGVRVALARLVGSELAV